MLLKQVDAYIMALQNTPYSWAAELLSQLEMRFRPGSGEQSQFPCVFAQNAFNRSNIKFLLVPFDHESGGYRYDILLSGLHSYLQDAATWDGDVNTAEPLLAVFEPMATPQPTSFYEKTFIDSLQYLIDGDREEWIGDIPLDPASDFWTMCFAGTQLFINVSHPNNVNRLSRNLCDSLVFVINPRERFDAVAGDNRKGRLIREQIRRNIDLYDLIPRSPYLGHYQHGDLEWPQYMLPDDNEAKPMTCPLRFHKAKGQ